MRILVVAVGTRMPSWVVSGFEDYSARMPREMRVELVEIRPDKRAPGMAVERLLGAERERIRAALPKGCCSVALDERGRALTSSEFAAALAKWRQDGRALAFIIGGADGLAAELKTEADMLLSLSNMTLPHGLARVALAEQLYRAHTILSGHPYHRAMNGTIKRIYLASRSPRRRELLKQVGIPFEILLFREDAKRGADVDESPHADEDSREYVLRMARTKAESAHLRMAQRKLPIHPVLAADTTVVIDNCILGKPANQDEAQEMLSMLAGRRHEVLTAVAVCRYDRLETRLSVSSVEFAPISAARIRQYVATGEPLDKAGAYAIQGRAGAFVRHLSGSYTGVMGLPLYETIELLESVGLAT